MNIMFSSLHSLWSAVGPFFILLGILIFVHELGHFLVAKYFGVRVEVFSMGFGKKILSYTRGDTNYCLSLIPLGGYVKMYGDDPNAEVPPEEKQYAFLHKPLPQRFAIVLAGPLMNLFFAIFIFAAIVGMGEDVPGPYVGDVASTSAAYKDGFRSGDKVLKFGDEAIATWAQLQKAVEASAGLARTVQVERVGESAPLEFQVAVGTGPNENIFSSEAQVGVIEGLSQESRSTVVGVRDAQSPAAVAGVKTLDLITTVNGKKVSAWRELEGAFHNAVKPEAKTVVLEVHSADVADKPENIRHIEINLPADVTTAKDLVAELGLEPAELYLYQVTKGSPAEKAGLLARDRVIAVAGEPVTAWTDVINRVKSYTPESKPVEFKVLRDGQEKSFQIRPEMTSYMNPTKGQEEHRFTVGIASGIFPIGAETVFYRITNPVEILKHGVKETIYWTDFVVMSMVRLIQGQVSPRNLGGVITIGRVASHSFAAGLSTFMRMMGLISINLFLLNLLPIPVLDGGHLLFYSIEALRGAPLSMRKMEIAQQVGLMLLMFLMAFAFFNDITISSPPECNAG